MRWPLILTCMFVFNLWPATGIAENWRNVEIVQLNTVQYQLTEGPAWDGADTVYFTEIYKHSIHRYSLSANTFSRLTDQSGAANGMVFRNKLLWICEQDTGAIVQYNPVDGARKEFVTRYKNAAFNHPNDLTLDSHGGVYFTDPAWNEELHRKQPVNGVYYADRNGKPRLLISDTDKPNGVLLNKSETYLYVADMGNDRFTRYPVKAPGVLGTGTNFARLNTTDTDRAAPDGLEEDLQGNIYVAAENGIQVYSSDGDFLTRIVLPLRPTNLEFTNRARTQLLVTTMHHLYSVTIKN